MVAVLDEARQRREGALGGGEVRIGAQRLLLRAPAAASADRRGSGARSRAGARGSSGSSTIAPMVRAARMRALDHRRDLALELLEAVGEHLDQLQVVDRVQVHDLHHVTDDRVALGEEAGRVDHRHRVVEARAAAGGSRTRCPSAR